MTFPKYDKYQYLYPPRAPGKHAIDQSQIRFITMQGYGGQKKKNGTNNTVYANGSEVIFMPRHGADKPHKQWAPLPEHVEFFKQFGPKWFVFCTELLHAKVSDLRHQIFIHDVLVWGGQYLVGSTFIERQAHLQSLVEAFKGEDEGDQYRIHPNITVAKLYSGNPREMKALYANLKPEDEGLVFKKLTGTLKPCISEDSNADWQFKCRVPWAAGTF